jgi:hypothetical protein
MSLSHSIDWAAMAVCGQSLRTLARTPKDAFFATAASPVDTKDANAAAARNTAARCQIQTLRQAWHGREEENAGGGGICCCTFSALPKPLAYGIFASETTARTTRKWNK